MCFLEESYKKCKKFWISENAFYMKSGSMPLKELKYHAWCNFVLVLLLGYKSCLLKVDMKQSKKKLDKTENISVFKAFRIYFSHKNLSDCKWTWLICSFLFLFFFPFFFFFFFGKQFELLLCVQEEGDPCLKIVEPLMEKYPQVDARLFIGECTCCLNIIFVRTIYSKNVYIVPCRTSVITFVPLIQFEIGRQGSSSFGK